MVKSFCKLFLVLFFTFVSLKAQSISVSATTDTSKYKVGDYITLTLELRYDKNYTVSLPPVKDSLKVLEYINTLPVEKKENDEKIIEYHKFVFSKYDSGKVTIPSLQIFYSDSKNGEKKFIATVPFEITVTTIKVNTQEDIRDVKEPLTISLPWWMIALAVLLFLGIIAGAYFGYKYWKKKKSGKIDAKPEIIIPPHEIALAKLDELEQKKLWQNGKVKEFHSEVTEIVREYFETRFNFRAMEMPSSEMLPVLSVIEDAKKIFVIAEKFFSNADLVKFAKFEPMPQVNDEMMKQAFEIVKQTIPQVVVETPAETKPAENGDANVQ
jgi:hypothetical protein